MVAHFFADGKVPQGCPLNRPARIRAESAGDGGIRAQDASIRIAPRSAGALAPPLIKRGGGGGPWTHSILRHLWTSQAAPPLAYGPISKSPFEAFSDP
jgi:hypothetical protein